MGNTKLANPAPLGLMGFGMTTILLNTANSGLFAFDVAIPRWAFFTAALRKFLPACWNTKRQHFWLNRFYLLRQLLADAGGDSSDAEDGPQTRQTRTSSVCTSACGASLPCLCSLAP